MRTLFISSRWPENFDLFTYGTAKRLLTMLEALNRHSDHIDMLFFPLWWADVSEAVLSNARKRIAQDWGIEHFSLTVCVQDKVTSDLDQLWRGYLRPATSIHRQPAFEPVSGEAHLHAFEACLARNPDLIFAHRLNSMCPIMLSRKPMPPIYLDLDDVEHRAFARGIDQPPHWRSKHLLRLQLPALERAERQAVTMTKKTFVCSELDELYLKQRWHTDRIAAIPNAIPVPEPTPAVTDKTVLFIGILNYEPNRVAAEYLIEHVWPRVRQRVPDARLVIAGRFPEGVAHYQLPPPGVEFAGFVDDLDRLYAGIRVVACPILSGGGTRIKIIEAAAYGKPVVSTHIGAEGLAFENEEDILLRDDPTEFAEAVVKVLQSDNLAVAVGTKARAKAVSLYERTAVIDSIAKAIFGAR